MTVLAKTESYPVADRRRGKSNRGTSSYHGRHGAGGAMCQSRIVWAGWAIREKVRKFGVLGYQISLVEPPKK